MFACVHVPGLADSARLRACAADFSPWVEQTAHGTVTFAVGGLARLFGSAPQLAQAIAQHAAELGFEANVALAANPDAAVHGGRGFRGITLMEPGKEASLPLELLEPPEDIALTLALWGIRTFGELAALPEDGVAERLGPAGVHLQKLARGAGDRPLVPCDPPPPFEEAYELDYPLTLLEPLAFILGRLLNQLCARLDSQGLAAHELHLRLKLDEGEHTRTLRLPYPMRDSRAFLKLLTLDLEAHPPQRPVLAVHLKAEPVNPRVVQHGLFLPAVPEPQKLELTLARITKLVGEGNAGSPELLDTHRPGAFRMRHFVAGEPRPSGRGAARLALRVFRPALAATVPAPQGRPVCVTARGVSGKVLVAAGPWRTAGDWWREDAWSRDEWDVALSDGALYRLCRDRRSGAWFLDGTYD